MNTRHIRAVAAAGLLLCILFAQGHRVAATASPGRIVFGGHINNVGGGVYVVNDDTGGSGAAKIVQDYSLDGYSWSPDGHRIAFTRFVVDASGRAAEAIFVVNDDGTNLTQLTYPPLVATPFGGVYIPHRYPRWSPDGSTISFSRVNSYAGGPNDPLMLVDVATGTETWSGVFGEYSDWSPDGLKLVFNDPRQAGIRVLTLATGTVDVINPAFGGQPVWSHDGLQIAFRQTGGDASGIGIWVMNSDGSGPYQVIADRSLVQFDIPKWSPDDSEIGYRVWTQSGGSVGATKLSDATFRTVVAPGQAGVTYINDFDWAPAPAAPPPTPGKIAFVSTRDGNQEIYAMNDDGSNQTRLTDNAADDVSPAWSPDGSKIAFSSNRSGNYDIWVMNADGTNPVQVTSDPADDGAPDWSSDGTQIVFNSTRNGGDYNVWIMNADGTGLVQVTTGGQFDGDPVFAPDGSQVAFGRQADPWDIWLIAPDGSGATNFTNSPVFSGAHNTVPAWSPDGTRIAFSHLYDGNNYEIVYKSLAGGSIVRLTNEAGLDFFVTWSPDSKKLAFNSARTGNDEIFVMNADGTNPVNISNNPFVDQDPDWTAGSVDVATSTTTLDSSANPSQFGDQVTLTAHVSGSAGTPTGDVNFYDGNTLVGTVPIANGDAAFLTSSLTTGTHSMTAQYLGDGTFPASTSTAVSQVVDPAASTTTVTCGAGPFVYNGAAFTPCTAAATGAGSLNQPLSVNYSNNVHAGTANASASYGGDADHTGSSGNATFAIQAASTATTLTGPSQSVVGQQITLTAAVAVVAPGAGALTGSVRFYDGAALLGSATLVNGSATFKTSSLTPGAHALSAAYASASPDFLASASTSLSETVNPSKTVVTLTVSPSAPKAGQAVTLRGAVAAKSPGGGFPAGELQFRDGQVMLGSAIVSNGGTASVVIQSITAGRHSFTATFVGSASYEGSSASANVQVK